MKSSINTCQRWSWGLPWCSNSNVLTLLGSSEIKLANNVFPLVTGFLNDVNFLFFASSVYSRIINFLRVGNLCVKQFKYTLCMHNFYAMIDSIHSLPNLSVAKVPGVATLVVSGCCCDDSVSPVVRSLSLLGPLLYKIVIAARLICCTHHNIIMKVSHTKFSSLEYNGIHVIATPNRSSLVFSFRLRRA